MDVKRILLTILCAPLIVIICGVALVTYYWWGYDYYRHVIN